MIPTCRLTAKRKKQQDDRERVLLYTDVLSVSQERFLVPAWQSASYIEKPIHRQVALVTHTHAHTPTVEHMHTWTPSCYSQSISQVSILMHWTYLQCDKKMSMQAKKNCLWCAEFKHHGILTNTRIHLGFQEIEYFPLK